MSKTDKDAPFWVQNSWHGKIDHDHSTGECIIGEDKRNKWNAWRNHWRKCNKRVTVEYRCTKDDPNFTPWNWRTRERTQTCWTWECGPDCDGSHDRWRFYCDDPVSTSCIGHRRVERDDSIPCACDERPLRPTCFPAWDVGRYYTWGGVPSWFVREIYHGPERRRARDSLRSMAREYNAYGDLEDGDYANRQARNSARWDWW